MDYGDDGHFSPFRLFVCLFLVLFSPSYTARTSPTSYYQMSKLLPPWPTVYFVSVSCDC